MRNSPLEARLLRSRRLLEILDRALDHQMDGELCLQLLQSQGKVAWTAHSGSFVLPKAEQFLRDLSSATYASSLLIDPAQTQNRTLHVLTEAYAVGGHARLVKRWIELLDDELHAVVIVRQGRLEPSWVVPPNRDVPLINLEAAGVRLRTSKVAHLAQLFRSARRVILHIHPDDVCSVAAAYAVPEVDIRFLNHADHVAWLGAGIPSATYLNLRARGTKLAASRRGIVPDSCDVVPIPITPPQEIGRLDARQQIGLRTADIAILTIASGYKYNPIEGRSLLDMLDQILMRKDYRLIAIGSGPKHPVFGVLSDRHPGKVMAMGNIPAPDIYRAAADIYLDSYPFCSPTSMLESAARGTPIVAYQPNYDDLEILYSECPWLSRELYTAENPKSFIALVEALASDGRLRQTVFESHQSGMASHLPEGWRFAIKRHLSRSTRRTPWNAPVDSGSQTILDITLAGLGNDARRHAWSLRRLGVRGASNLGLRNLALQCESLVWCANRYAGYKISEWQESRSVARSK